MNPPLPSNGVRIQAFAKLNLGLEVLHKRSDGYHNIRSVFATISLADLIDIQPSDTLELDCLPAMTTSPTENLAYRAAATILAHPSANGRGAKITLRKRIPAGGGLGGGSADAAAVLMGLQDLYELPISDDELHTMALSIGSDVPFFLTGGSAIVEGRGESVTPVSLQLPYKVIIVLPHIHVDTKDAYAHMKPHDRGTTQSFLQIFDNIDTYKDQLVNDFESYVFAQHPILQQVKTSLYEKGALYASMSGSGSTMYGLFTDVDNFAAELQDIYPSMDVVACDFVPATTPRTQP